MLKSGYLYIIFIQTPFIYIILTAYTISIILQNQHDSSFSKHVYYISFLGTTYYTLNMATNQKFWEDKFQSWKVENILHPIEFKINENVLELWEKSVVFPFYFVYYKPPLSYLHSI